VEKAFKGDCGLGLRLLQLRFAMTGLLHPKKPGWAFIGFAMTVHTRGLNQRSQRERQVLYGDKRFGLCTEHGNDAFELPGCTRFKSFLNRKCHQLQRAGFWKW
jgi:hypothetical protein